MKTKTPFGDYTDPEYSLYEEQKRLILLKGKSIEKYEREIDDELNFLTQDGYGGNWSESKKPAIKSILIRAIEYIKS